MHALQVSGHNDLPRSDSQMSDVVLQTDESECPLHFVVVMVVVAVVVVVVVVDVAHLSVP